MTVKKQLLLLTTSCGAKVVFCIALFPFLAFFLFLVLFPLCVGLFGRFSQQLPCLFDQLRSLFGIQLFPQCY